MNLLNENINISKIIERYELPNDTKRILKKTMTKKSNRPGYIHSFNNRLYFISPSEHKVYHLWSNGKLKEMSHQNNIGLLTLVGDNNERVNISLSKAFFKRLDGINEQSISI